MGAWPSGAIPVARWPGGGPGTNRKRQRRTLDGNGYLRPAGKFGHWFERRAESACGWESSKLLTSRDLRAVQAHLPFPEQRWQFVGRHRGRFVAPASGPDRSLLASPTVSPATSLRRIFEDREGTVWVSTEDGLDRFREFAVPTIAENQQGLSTSAVTVLEADPGWKYLDSHGGWAESLAKRACDRLRQAKCARPKLANS